MDSRLEALVYIANHYRRPVNREALLHGLPLENGRLTDELCLRAAERVPMDAKLIQRELDEIVPPLTPLVFFNLDGDAMVLERIDNGRYVVFDTVKQALTDVDAGQLAGMWSSRLIVLKPRFAFMEDRESEESDRSQSARSFLFDSFRRSSKLYIEVVAATFLVNMFVVVTPLFVMNVYDKVVPNLAYETLWALAIGVAIVYLFDFIVKQLRSYFIDIAGKRIDLEINRRIFERILDIRREAQPRSVGGFANQIREIETLRDFVSSATLSTLTDLPFLLVFIAVIGIIGGWQMATIPLAFIPILFMIGLYSVPRLRRAVNESMEDSTRQHATLIETLSSLETVKTQRAESTMQYKWEYYSARSALASMKARWISSLTVNLALFFQQNASVILIIVGVYVIEQGSLSLGGLIACSLLTGRALAPITQAATLITRFNQAGIALRSLQRLLSLPTEHFDDKRFLYRDHLTGDIELRNVTFRYPDSDLTVLRELNLALNPGQRIGVLGRIGSGKSTLAKLLLKLYEPSDGAVLFDRTDYRQLDPVFLRKNIGYVPQDPTLFNGSIKDNIVLSDPTVSDSRLAEIAEKCGVLEFVNQFPDGFDHQVGERAERLSGGQRQAIVLARSLIHNPPIVILDEPTSFMDTSTEDSILNRLEEELANKTVVVITHRATLLRWVDHLIVMDNGKVMLNGPKSEVIDALGKRQL